ncbi:MAG: hypothetical protein HGA54_08825, partial [Actinobacteria bacterium]|nr:hypothetical protein [Actinomycetota bacterium]
IPVISLVAKKENIKTLCYWFILCFINVTIFPLLSSLGLEFTSFLEIPIAFSFLNYILLGWLLDNVYLSMRIRGLIYAGGVVGLLMMFFGTSYLSMRAGAIDARIMEYSSVACMLQATALFVLIKSIDWSFLQRKQLDKKVALLSSASFGVYLTHLIVMDCLIHVLVRVSPGMLASAWFILPKALIVYVLSVGIVLVVKRIPVLRHVYP